MPRDRFFKGESEHNQIALNQIKLLAWLVYMILLLQNLSRIICLRVVSDGALSVMRCKRSYSSWTWCLCAGIA